MKVPLLDLKPQLQSLEKEIKNAVNEVIDSCMYILGPKVSNLEKEVAAYSGAGFGVGVTSGTDALLVALMALDVKPGDLVLTTPYSFFATAGVVARLNATPVFVDIDPVTYNISPAALAAWFDANPDKAKKVKAIIPVHLYGQCADMDAIMAIANAHGVAVIEDAAQAIGAKYPSKTGLKKAGAMGTMGCFSFFPSKNLGCLGDGGMVVTSDAALADKLIKLRNHGMDPKYYHKMVGGNFRLDALQAAVLSVKLPHLDSWHAARQKNAAFYDEHLTAPGLNTPQAVYGRENHIYNQYMLSVPGKRDELRDFLVKNEIGHDVYYPVSFHEQECFKDLGYKTGDFPASEYASQHVIALPIYPDLATEQLAFVAEKINEFYR